MRTGILSLVFGFVGMMVCGTSVHADLASNGNFELGDTSGWEVFPTGASTFEAISSPASDIHEGSFSGNLTNTATGSAAVIKQANLAVGIVNPGDEFEISFWAKGTFVNGGVSFVELFSELDGGGTSSNEILLTMAGTSSDYTEFNFTRTAGPDVSGGITLQMTATTGATAGSTASLFIDNVSIRLTSVPEPASAIVLGMAGLGLASRRRRMVKNRNS